jgi:hypothetical protein
MGIRIRLFTLKETDPGSDLVFQNDADPEPAFKNDADPDPKHWNKDLTFRLVMITDVTISARIHLSNSLNT